MSLRALVCVLFLAGTCLLHAQHPARSEYDVKAAFLLNFVKFVEWPEPESPNEQIVICVVGEDPFGPTLDQLVEGETIGQRKIGVHRIQGPHAEPCHVAFISKTEKDVPKRLASFSAGTLTVGEGDHFLSHGGMIAFVIDNRRVRFDISQAALKNAGLKVSSRLLSVARTVEK